jgi:hypothetical protein
LRSQDTLTGEYKSSMYGWKPKNHNRVGKEKFETMKNKLAIENFNEIPVQEQQDINGGFWPFVISVALVAIGEIIEDWDNFKNGLTGRPEEKNP